MAAGSLRRIRSVMNKSDPGLNRYLQEIGRIPLLTPQQEIELAAKIKKGDASAREQMIKRALYGVLGDEVEVERIFLIVKAQREY